MTGCNPPSAKRMRLDLSEDVKLVIGTEETKEITVHKSVLTKRSTFFKSCCDGHSWKESTTKTVQLPEGDFEVLSAYLHWLYVDEVMATEDDDLIIDARTKDVEAQCKISNEYYSSLAQLAILADKYTDTAFNHAVIDKFVAGSENLCMSPGCDVVCDSYANLPTTSPIRRFLVDTYFDCMTIRDFERCRERLPYEFCV